MALEIAGARLLAPSFGMSMPVWATLIGLTLAGLAAGSALSGIDVRRAAAGRGWRSWARPPGPLSAGEESAAACRYNAAAGAAIGGMWVAATWAIAPVALLSGKVATSHLDAPSAAAFLVAAATFVAWPTVFLGMVVPLVIAGSQRDDGPRAREGPSVREGSSNPAAPAHGWAAGGSGRILAWSTLGSLAGTFGTAFGTLPLLGVRLSLAAWGAALMLVAALALVAEPARSRSRLSHAMAAGVTCLAAVMVLLARTAATQPPVGHADRTDGARLIAWREGRTHYIEIVESAGRRFLLFDEGAAVQSIHDADRPLTGTVWDDIAAAPLLAPGDAPPAVRRALVVGLAGGTVARTLAAAWPGVRIDGVEIDPDVIDISRAHLGLSEIVGLTIHIADGRVWMNRRCASRSDGPSPSPPYDLIALDAYRGPYPPFHLMTREFFTLARRCLAPGGIVALNLVDPAGDGGTLTGSAAATLATVFGWIGQIERPDAYNRVLVASGAPPGQGAFDARRTALATDGATNTARAAADAMAGRWRMAVPLSADARILTDDRAPVERLVEADVWRAVR